jgi:hypothetical protein
MIDQSWPFDQNGRVLDTKKKKTIESSVLGWFCNGGFGFGDFSGFAKLEDHGAVSWSSDFKRNTTNP